MRPTQLAKTKRALFVEGKDFQILGKFARKIGDNDVGNRRNFAVVPVEGFNPERIRNLKAGMEITLGTKIIAAAILDRDYRCKSECDRIVKECAHFCDFSSIHDCKEIENFLLVPEAMDRALAQKLSDRRRRTGEVGEYTPMTREVLLRFANEKKTYVTSQLITERRRFERATLSGAHDAQISQAALEDCESEWAKIDRRLAMVPGKEALSYLNKFAQERHGVSLTPTAIVDAMKVDEIPPGLRELVKLLGEFSRTNRRPDA